MGGFNTSVSVVDWPSRKKNQVIDLNKIITKLDYYCMQQRQNPDFSRIKGTFVKAICCAIESKHISKVEIKCFWSKWN